MPRDKTTSTARQLLVKRRLLQPRKGPRSSLTTVDLVWSPFPDQILPLQAHNPGGPMDIAAMLDLPNNELDQMNRHGFRFASTKDPNLGSSAYHRAAMTTGLKLETLIRSVLPYQIASGGDITFPHSVKQP